MNLTRNILFGDVVDGLGKSGTAMYFYIEGECFRLPDAWFETGVLRSVAYNTTLCVLWELC